MPLTRTNKKPRTSEAGRSFAVTGHEGASVKRILKDSAKYITVHELRTPAKVVDKLRRDFADLGLFNRNSMKLGVRKILQLQEVVTAVNGHWGNSVEASDPDDDHIVSNN